MEEWSSLCRCCLSTGAETSLLIEDVKHKFYETTTIDVNEEDGLPQSLCDDCLSVMNVAHQFKKQCLRIDTELKVQLVEVNNHAQQEMDDRRGLELPGDQTEAGDAAKNGPVIKSEPVESDDDCYYVLVIDDEKEEKYKEANESQSTSEINFEQSVDSFLVKSNPVEENEVETIEVIPDTNAEQFRYEQEADSCENRLIPTGLNLDHNTLISGEGNFFKILGNGTTENLLLQGEKGNEIVTYIMDNNLEENDDLTREEVIVCEGDESQFQIVNYDGSELVIEYANDGQIASTVVRQENGKLLCMCGEEFSDFTELEMHQSTHHSDQENHLCSLCGKGFESNEILTGHMQLHTNSRNIIQCPFCDQKIKRNSITQHIKYNHNNIKPRCPVCQKTFANPNNLKRHMTIHSGIKQYQCDSCPKRFHQKISLQTHKTTHLGDGGCEKCDSHFATISELIAHRELHGCEEKVSFKCHTCNKEFAVEAELRCHMMNLHDEKPLELLCSECGEVLPTRRALAQHLAQHRDPRARPPGKRFECSTCSKQCTSQAMLIMHERVHTNERPFQCPLCALRFKTKTHLRTHQLTHTREKRFGCSVCMKFFALKGNLVVHLRTHTGERPYVCSICNEAFIDSKYLKKHKEKKHLITNVPWNQY